jgi:antitoxin MazE
MPKKLIDKSQAYFWTRRWQKAEKEAAEDMKAGRVKTFDSVDELIKGLDRK